MWVACTSPRMPSPIRQDDLAIFNSCAKACVLPWGEWGTRVASRGGDVILGRAERRHWCMVVMEIRPSWRQRLECYVIVYREDQTEMPFFDAECNH